MYTQQGAALKMRPQNPPSAQTAAAVSPRAQDAYAAQTAARPRPQGVPMTQTTAATPQPQGVPTAQTTATHARTQDAYRRQDVMTASATELIVMLYDALKKNIVLGRRGIQKKDIQNAHNHLVKAQAIVTELMTCLDMSYPISEELLLIYDFMSRTLKEANIRKDLDTLEPLLEIVDSLREAWKEVSQQNRGSLYQSETQAQA